MSQTITLKQAADEFGCAVSTLKNWAKKGELPFVQNGGEKSARLVDRDIIAHRLKNTPDVKSIFTKKEDANKNEKPKSDAVSSEKELPSTPSVTDTGTPADTTTPDKQPPQPPKADKSQPSVTAEAKPPSAKKPHPSQQPKHQSAQRPNEPHKKNERNKNSRKPPRLQNVLDLAQKLSISDQLKLANRLRRQMEDIY